jgi:hypothetical protein
MMGRVMEERGGRISERERVRCNEEGEMLREGGGGGE